MWHWLLYHLESSQPTKIFAHSFPNPEPIQLFDHKRGSRHSRRKHIAPSQVAGHVATSNTRSLQPH
ncbi:hypothetical protein OIU76_005702 [Salix suchowensis]|nr:hypothetical protein OIU76_005702 [Salix suchowensis]